MFVSFVVVGSVFVVLCVWCASVCWFVLWGVRFVLVCVAPCVCCWFGSDVWVCLVSVVELWCCSLCHVVVVCGVVNYSCCVFGVLLFDSVGSDGFGVLKCDVLFCASCIVVLHCCGCR